MLALPGLALPQAASQSELELCASLASAELKLACFEALTAKYSQRTAVADPPPAAPPRSDARDTVTPLPEHAAPPPASDEEDNGAFTAIVVKVERDQRLRLHTFIMDNGDTWRQMESGMLSYPKDGPFEVEIRRGFMGDYQMRIGDQDRMTRIVKLR